MSMKRQKIRSKPTIPTLYSHKLTCGILCIINRGNRREIMNFPSILFNRPTINKAINYFEVNRAYQGHIITGFLPRGIFYTAIAL